LWIVDEYHQSPHRGLGGKVPYQAWKEQEALFPPMLPVNYEMIRYTKGDIRTPTIHDHKGVVIENIFYNDPEGRLRTIGRQLGSMGEDRRVTCEYSPNDIGSITVVDPFTDERFVVYTQDQRVRKGMSLSEFQAAYPTAKKTKGFGHKRKVAQSEMVQQKREEHAAKVRKARARKSQPAHEDEITNQVHSMRSERHAKRPADTDTGSEVTESKATATGTTTVPAKPKGFAYD
jgi:putative transposase